MKLKIIFITIIDNFTKNYRNTKNIDVAFKAIRGVQKHRNLSFNENSKYMKLYMSERLERPVLLYTQVRYFNPMSFNSSMVLYLL